MLCTTSDPVKKPNTLTLLFMVCFPSVGAIVISPALTDIAHAFNVADGTASQAVTVYLLGYALGQLVFGPLAYAYGRKKPLFIGILISIIAAFMCVVAGEIHSFSTLLVARFIMAMSASAGLKISFTLIADVYTPKEGRKVITAIVTAAAIIPGIATAAGAYLVEWMNWYYAFYFFCLYGLLLLLPVYYLPDTVKGIGHQALNVKNMMSNYKNVLRNRFLIVNSLIFGEITSLSYLFVTSAPIIAVNTIGLTVAQYGSLVLIVNVGFLLGSLLAAFLANHWTAKKMMIFGIIALVIPASTMLICFLLSDINIYSLFLPLFFMMFGSCALIVNVSSLAPSQLDDKANASAIMNFINMGTAVGSTFIIGFLQVLGATVLPVIFVVLILAIVVLYSAGIHRVEIAH